MAKFYGTGSGYLKNNERKNNRNFWIIYWVLFFIFVLSLLLYKVDTKITVALILALAVVTKAIDPLMDLYIKKRNHFRRGREGEEDILDELHGLSHDYSVFYDFNLPQSRGNIDIAVVGPTGIFTLEVKSHRGKIGFNGSQLTLNGYPFKEKDLLHQAMSQALVLKGVFRDFYSQDWFVKSVLVFSSDKAFLQLNWKPIRNVSVIQKRSLLKYLEAGLPSFPRDQQKLLEQILIPLTKS